MSEGFYGLPTAKLANDHLQLTYLTTAGPRLVRLSFGTDGRNWLAEAPDKFWETDYGRFYIRGGHRLWHAPETAARTYIPDNEGLTVTPLDGGVRLTGEVEPGSGIQKQLDVVLHPDQPRLTLTHTLINRNLWPIDLAAWSLTMMALGGTAVIPQTQGDLDPDGLQPNRHLVLWPYTQWQDSRLHLYDDFVFVDGNPQLPPAKIGTLNRHGWLGYLRDGVLFVKQFTPQPAATHIDFGCNVELYVNDECLELETLTPLTRLEPDTAVHHTETWSFVTGVPDMADETAVRDYLAQLDFGAAD